MAAVTIEQIGMMLDFMENHHDMALGRFGRTIEGRTLSKMLWGELARELNSVPNGISKSAQAWRTYYNEFKSKTMTRLKAYKKELQVSGEAGRKKTKFTPLHLRLYNILGSASESGEPLLQVDRRNSLNKTNNGTNGSRPDADAEANNTFSLWSLPELPQFDLPSINDSDDADADTAAAGSLHAMDDDDDDDDSRHRGVSVSRRATSPSARHAQEPDVRRRRVCSRDEQDQRTNYEDSVKIEKLKMRLSQQQTSATRYQAHAIRVHAQAITRLAAAVDRVADALTNDDTPIKKQRFSFVPVAASDDEDDRQADEDDIKDEDESGRERASDD